jgi:hypothetical protein
MSKWSLEVTRLADPYFVHRLDLIAVIVVHVICGTNFYENVKIAMLSKSVGHMLNRQYDLEYKLCLNVYIFTRG